MEQTRSPAHRPSVPAPPVRPSPTRPPTAHPSVHPPLTCPSSILHPSPTHPLLIHPPPTHPSVRPSVHLSVRSSVLHTSVIQPPPLCLSISGLDAEFSRQIGLAHGVSSRTCQGALWASASPSMRWRGLKSTSISPEPPGVPHAQAQGATLRTSPARLHGGQSGSVAEIQSLVAWPGLCLPFLCLPFSAAAPIQAFPPLSKFRLPFRSGGRLENPLMRSLPSTAVRGLALEPGCLTCPLAPFTDLSVPHFTHL